MLTAANKYDLDLVLNTRATMPGKPVIVFRNRFIQSPGILFSCTVSSFKLLSNAAISLRNAAVVDALLTASLLQGEICGGPAFPPLKQLLLTVPAQSCGILTAIAAAFGVLVRTGEALRLRCGWGHVDFLFANFIGVLLYLEIST